MREWLALAALGASSGSLATGLGGFDVVAFASAADGPGVVATNNDGHSYSPISAEMSAGLLVGADDMVLTRNSGREAVQPPETGTRRSREKHEKVLGQDEEASTGNAIVDAAPAVGSGVREEQELVTEDLHYTGSRSGSHSNAKNSDFPRRDMEGNSVISASGSGFSKGGGDAQSLLLLNMDPLSPLLLLPRAPRMAGMKSFVLGLVLLLLAGWIILEGDDTVAFGPAHSLASAGDLDREDVSSIASTLLVLIGALSLLSAVYRHLHIVRQQLEWIQKAEEGIETARMLHQSRLKRILARQRYEGVITDVGKYG
ncbi:hypothetical protein, conserved [Eimeria maxima]|uniref:Transmembrane protein n=1 Tax=Eimeria maxima TaxID=5804 RepID=U6MF08_EIMMA|nr:hypothetical protein, conserved [Eimeria maxima]CDJ61633.1 hypothetical protein, conserved [Eimeria maxima]